MAERGGERPRARGRAAVIGARAGGGLVFSQREVPAACGAPAIDRRTLSATGAIGLRRVDGKWIAEPVRSPIADRPWYGRALLPEANALARFERRPPAKPAVEVESPLATPGEVPVPELPEEPGR